MAFPGVRSAQLRAMRRILGQVLLITAAVVLFPDCLSQGRADFVPTDAFCGKVAEGAFDLLAEDADTTLLVTNNGCDIAGADFYDFCDAAGTNGTCAAVPGCSDPDVPTDSTSCTPEVMHTACCQELISKPCASCRPRTRFCVEVCLPEEEQSDDSGSASVSTAGSGSASTGEFEGGSPSFSPGFSPPASPAATTTDAVCAAVGVDMLELFAVEVPLLFDTSCTYADAGKPCEVEGSSGFCATERECDSEELVVSKGCETAPADESCCIRFLAKPCDTCLPVTTGCTQFCASADSTTPSRPPITSAPVYAPGPTTEGDDMGMFTETPPIDDDGDDVKVVSVAPSEVEPDTPAPSAAPTPTPTPIPTPLPPPAPEGMIGPGRAGSVPEASAPSPRSTGGFEPAVEEEMADEADGSMAEGDFADADTGAAGGALTSYGSALAVAIVAAAVLAVHAL